MDKTSYALGMSIGSNLLQSGVNKLVFEDFAAGVKAVMTGSQPELSAQECNQVLQEFFDALEAEQNAAQAAVAGQMKEQGEAFLKENAGKDGVKVTASGLQYKVLEKGSGKKPGPKDRVRCHYEGTLVDGSKFDSSYDRNEPAVFGVNQVIAGWTEALQMMSEGSKWDLYIPYQLAYGEAGAHGAIPPCAALIFTVELIEVL